MAGNFTFHNKFHRSNHHTISSAIVDSGRDPIASREYPFRGIFYNIITDQSRTFFIPTNSLEWHSAFTTMSGFSGNWMKTQSLFTTVCSTSGEWNLGYSGYTSLCANSANYSSAYTTVCAFSASWGSPLLMFTNKVQEYTHAKTFSGVDLIGDDSVSPALYEWDLNTQQVAFVKLTKNIKIENPIEETIINGGTYTLVFFQDNLPVANNGYQVTFDTNYRFNTSLYFDDIVNQGLSATTIINFIAINGIMYGEVVVLTAYP
jgi:hypothetical protein